jgi:hypothetical protein
MRLKKLRSLSSNREILVGIARSDDRRAGNDRFAGQRAHAGRKARAVELVFRVADEDVALPNAAEDEPKGVAHITVFMDLEHKAFDLVERGQRALIPKCQTRPLVEREAACTVQLETLLVVLEHIERFLIPAEAKLVPQPGPVIPFHGEIAPQAKSLRPVSAIPREDEDVADRRGLVSGANRVVPERAHPHRWAIWPYRGVARLVK